MTAPHFTQIESAATRWVAAVFLLVGAVCLGFAGWLYLRERAFLTRGVHTTGRVTSMDEGYQPKVGRTSQPVFEFTDASGVTFTISSHEDGYPCHIGDSVPVIYNPDNPAEAQLGGVRAAWDTTFIMAGFGLFFFAGGVNCALPHRAAFRAVQVRSPAPRV